MSEGPTRPSEATAARLSARRIQALIVLAVAVRVAAIFALGVWRGGPAAAGAYEHDFIARQILEGHGFAYPFYAVASGAVA